VIFLNPGYLSLLLMLVAAILLASGWKTALLGRVSGRDVALFVVLWAASMQFRWTWNGAIFYGAWPVAFGLVAVLLWRSENWFRRWHVVVTGILLGSVYMLLQELYAIDPMFVLVGGNYDAVLWLSVICLMMRRKSFEQIGSLTIGLLLGELLAALFHHEGRMLVFGSPTFQDHWWLAVMTVRSASVAIGSALLLARKWASRIPLPRRGGWRG